jgi:hypothetical protein
VTTNLTTQSEEEVPPLNLTAKAMAVEINKTREVAALIIKDITVAQVQGVLLTVKMVVTIINREVDKVEVHKEVVTLTIEMVETREDL